MYESCNYTVLSMYNLCMANKHDQFENFIMERLARGAMKSQIARDLVAQGVSSTPDQLSRWLNRRAARIQSNAVLVNPLNAAVSVPPTPAKTESHSPSIQQNPALVARSMPTRKSSISGQTKDSSARELDELINQTAQEPPALLKKK